MMNTIKAEFDSSNSHREDAEKMAVPSDEAMRCIIEDVSQYWRSKIWEIRTEYGIQDDIE